MKTLLLLLTLLLPLHAAEEPTLKVRFAAQALPESMAEVVLITGAERSEPFAIPLYNLSGEMEVAGRAFTIQSTASEKAKIPVGLPAQGKPFIVLLVRDAEQGLAPVIVPAVSPGFGRGDVYFQNVTSRQLVGNVGSTKFSIPPFSGKSVRPSGAKIGLYDVLIGSVEKKQIRPISTTRWPENNTQRSYLIFYENPSTKWIEFRAIDEFLPAPEKE